jgi:hypothetical protein
MTSTEPPVARKDDAVTKSLGVVAGLLILTLGIISYGILLPLFVFTSFLLFSRRWASLGWAILSKALVGVGFYRGDVVGDWLL